MLVLTTSTHFACRRIYVLHDNAAAHLCRLLKSSLACNQVLGDMSELQGLQSTHSDGVCLYLCACVCVYVCVCV